MNNPGIDLVYLPDALSRKRADHNRYLEIVFNPDERKYLDVEFNTELLIHGFWAVKEASYKSEILRNGSVFSFVPRKVNIIDVKIHHASFMEVGTIIHGHRKLLNVHFYDTYVIAFIQGSNFKVYDVGQLSKFKVRQFLQSEKQKLIDNQIGSSILFSHTHDGKYAALNYLFAEGVADSGIDHNPGNRLFKSASHNCLAL